ncbi:hypothetical protein [Calothrix sp. 336/3]|uniref:hypothetical protein n=1 Tax=Calothrix sp. 336/3 TaxID=1337936 RepID=UPI000699FB27|nr:hypothetical protein [Calothrix sp. 336/3]
MKKTLINFCKFVATVAVFGVAIAPPSSPASAQEIIIINPAYPYPIRRQPPVGNFIYGSPIPTPIPVNPYTGLIPRRSSYYDYNNNNYYNNNSYYHNDNTYYNYDNNYDNPSWEPDRNPRDYYPNSSRQHHRNHRDNRVIIYR